jgi:hypothetical protein
MNTESLIQTLTQCARNCDDCTAACLAEDDVNRLKDCIRNNLVCAAACRFTALALQHDSPHLYQIVTLCETVCSTCESSCSQHEHQHCKTCAVVCRESAAECKRWFELQEKNAMAKAPPY